LKRWKIDHADNRVGYSYCLAGRYLEAKQARDESVNHD
jgi:hypothetical protein